MGSLLANKYVQLLLNWMYRKVILPYLKDKALDLAVDVRVKAALVHYESRYEKVVKEYDDLRAKNTLTEAEIVRIRNEKIKLEESLLNSIKR